MNALFNKKNNSYVLSGSCAIYVALMSNLSKHSKVLIPNNVCARVLEVVLMCDMIPIIIYPSNGLTIMSNDIKTVLNKYDFDAVILVHNYGIECDTTEIRTLIPNKLIIEDCAQYWNENTNIGTYSDIVITSIDSNKPLVGSHMGIIAYNDNININLDYGVKNRYMPYLKSPFALTEEPLDENMQIIIKNASNKTIKYNKNLLKLQKILLNYPQIKYPDKECYNLKFPLIFKTKRELNKFMELADKYKLTYSEPHERLLQDLPFLQEYDYYYIDNNKSNKYQLYIKLPYLDDNYINTISKVLEEMTK